MSVERELKRRAQDKPFDPERGGEPLAWVYQSSPKEERPSGFLNPAQQDRRLVYVPMDPKSGAIQLNRAAFVDASKLALHEAEHESKEASLIRRYVLLQQIDGLVHPVQPAKRHDVLWALSLYLGRLRMHEMSESYTP